MKLIIINGSPRSIGATGQLLRYIQDKITDSEPDTEIEYVELGKYKMECCSGCLACYKTGRCHIEADGLESLSHRISESEGLIIGSPTYASNVSAQCKILIDRGHFVFEQLLRDKPCFSLVTYENARGSGAQKVLNDLIQYSGGAVCCRFKKKLNHGATPLDIATREKLDRLCLKYLQSSKRKSPLSPGEKVKRTLVFQFGLAAHAGKNPLRYKAVLNRWQDMGIV